jgi:predicted nucleotidyltransferase/ubiquinone/menaquinone biosynthesis C-methylase UbiE
MEPIMRVVGETLRERRMTQARQAAAMLHGAGARRVWLFGSLARGEVSDRCTDLDLAVEGLSSDARWNMAKHLRRLFRCKVDVVGLEGATPAVRQAIAESWLFLPSRSIDGPERALLTEGALARLTRTPRPVGLHQLRLQAVFDALKAFGSRSVVDFGCGGGLLLERMAADPAFERILGVDSSPEALEVARRRLGLGGATDRTGRVRLLHALATNADPRFEDFDAAVAVEVIEHMDATRLAAFERVVFAHVRPATFIVTTPNAEFNVFFQSNDGPTFRHPDHCFEWTRDQFQHWIENAGQRAAYSCSIRGVGGDNTRTGPPTQMAVCTRCV